MSACYDGHLEIVKILVEKGKADLSKKNKKFTHKTALDYAKDQNHQEIVDYLKQKM